MAKDSLTDANKSGGPRDEANKRRFVDQSGVESHDLPKGGRATGDNDTVAEVDKRDLPQQHGGEISDDSGFGQGGIRGSADGGDALHHGGRKA